jgi:predicted amidohydrolase
MRHRWLNRFIYLTLTVVLILVFYILAYQKRPLTFEQMQVKITDVPILFQKNGVRSSRSFIGIEPVLIQAHYSSPEAFYFTINRYFQEAKRNDLLFENQSVVVLPEYIGTWLIVANEDASVIDSQTIDKAMESLVLHNLGNFLWDFLFAKSHSKDRLRETLFRMKANEMAQYYQSIFSRLAKEYKVSIVAGSIILPKPHIIKGQISITDGPLENNSFFFHPDGSIDNAIVRKSFLTTDEQDFLSPASIDTNPSYKTPIGQLYTMICADSWYPEAYAALEKSQATLLAIPSLVTPQSGWTDIWPGYSGHPNPIDVQAEDLNTIREHEAWTKYAMSGRLKSPRVKAAINVFLRGQLWDLTTGGNAFLMLNMKDLINELPNSEETNNPGKIYALFL